MSTRGEPLDHTDDDALIWNHVVLASRSPRFGSTLWTRSLMGDRTDAELMFYAQDNSLRRGVFWDVEWIYFRGQW